MRLCYMAITGVALGWLCLPLAAQEPSRWKAPEEAVPQLDVLKQIGVAKLIDLEEGPQLAILRPQIVMEVREEAYTVQVPFSESREVDGKPVTVERMRTETRTRAVPVARVLQTERRDIPLPTAEVYTLEGERLEMETVAERFQNPTHVLLLHSTGAGPHPLAQGLHPFYRSVLREDLLLLIVPAQPPQ